MLARRGSGYAGRFRLVHRTRQSYRHGDHIQEFLFRAHRLRGPGYKPNQAGVAPAPAVFDEQRFLTLTQSLLDIQCLQPASVPWSTVRPGPMVVDRLIFFMYTPLEELGLTLLRSFTSAFKFSTSAASSNETLPMAQ